MVRTENKIVVLLTMYYKKRKAWCIYMPKKKKTLREQKQDLTEIKISLGKDMSGKRIQGAHHSVSEDRAKAWGAVGAKIRGHRLQQQYFKLKEKRGRHTAQRQIDAGSRRKQQRNYVSSFSESLSFLLKYW